MTCNRTMGIAGMVCRLLSVVFYLSLTFINVSFAGPNLSAKLAVHSVAHSSKAAPCGLSISNFPCNPGGSSPFVTSSSPNAAYDVYVLVADGDSSTGVAGVSFGVSYDNARFSGVDILSATFCGDMEIHTDAWPDSAEGIRLTWNKDTHCRKTVPAGDTNGGVTALVGRFYVYAYGSDVLSLVPYPADLVVTLSNCASVLDTLGPPNVGQVGFGSTGTDPCH